MSNTVVAIGSNQIWAFSPAIDLLAQFPPPPPPATAAKPENAAATPAAPVAAQPAASSGPKSGASSALARLLLAAASPPSTAAPAAASSNGALSILLVETGDILTALKTIVLSHRHKTSGSAALTPLDLYMLDPESSSTARHLVLLSIAFDTTLSLRSRTELFLEVYGNALIQEKTQIYLNRKIKEIRKFLTSLAVLPGSASAAAASASPLSQSLFRGLVDLSHLKNKELDALEASLDFMTTQHTRQSFQAPPAPAAPANASRVEQGGVIIEEAGEEDEEEKKQSDAPASAAAVALPDRKPVATPAVHAAPVPFGQSVLAQKDKNAFDLETLREHRLRGYFADRFDARANLVDWDYHMRLKAVASIIHVIHYKRWRLTGQAFEERLCVYNLPNRTFASYREAQSKSRGGSVSVRGYWSDTLVSPYITLGVEASERRLFARKNQQHVKTSPHVCEFNLLSLLYELETGVAYSLPKKDGDSASSKSKRKEKKAPDAAADEEEIVELPADVPLPSSSAPMQIAPAAAAAAASSFAAAAASSSSSAASSSSSPADLPVAVSHTTPNAVPLSHARLIFLNGTVQALASKSRYASAFDRAYLSQFQVGCINETASARATAEAKKAAQPPATAVVDKINGVTSAASSAPAAAAAPIEGPDSLPLNKLLRPHAIITVETVKFLPVSVEIKESYLSRVRALAASAGWVAASPAAGVWSIGAFHSWSDRAVEQSMEEEEKTQATTQPMIVNFKWDGKAPAAAAAASAGKK